MYEEDARSLADLVEVRRDLCRRGIVSTKEVESAEALLSDAKGKREEAKRWIRDADDMIEEARRGPTANEK